MACLFLMMFLALPNCGGKVFIITIIIISHCGRFDWSRTSANPCKEIRANDLRVRACVRACVVLTVCVNIVNDSGLVNVYIL